jgi:hypothetical protein
MAYEGNEQTSELRRTSMEGDVKPVTLRATVMCVAIALSRYARTLVCERLTVPAFIKIAQDQCAEM